MHSFEDIYFTEQIYRALLGDYLGNYFRLQLTVQFKTCFHFWTSSGEVVTACRPRSRFWRIYHFVGFHVNGNKCGGFHNAMTHKTKCQNTKINENKNKNKASKKDFSS